MQVHSPYMFHLRYKNYELVEMKVQYYPILVKVHQLHLKKLAYEEEGGIGMKPYIPYFLVIRHILLISAY